MNTQSNTHCRVFAEKRQYLSVTNSTSSFIQNKSDLGSVYFNCEGYK